MTLLDKEDRKKLPFTVGYESVGCNWIWTGRNKKNHPVFRMAFRFKNLSLLIEVVKSSFVVAVERTVS
jgi:hypothetical protein